MSQLELKYLEVLEQIDGVHNDFELQKLRVKLDILERIKYNTDYNLSNLNTLKSNQVEESEPIQVCQDTCSNDKFYSSNFDNNEARVDATFDLVNFGNYVLSDRFKKILPLNKDFIYALEVLNPTLFLITDADIQNYKSLKIN